jgi:hypothetical protein
MLARVGKAIWIAYLNHLLWFTIGAVAGAVEAFLIVSAIYAGRCM